MLLAATSIPAAMATFLVGALVSTAASALLVSRIERVGGRIGLSEALLGMVAALCADGPEITSSVTALRSGQHAVGVGVVLGSNLFNLAALLGLGALVAGRISFHRRVVVLEGAVALVMVAAAILVAGGVLPPGAALAGGAIVFAPYLALIGLPSLGPLARIGVPERWRSWLARAVREEEAELEPIPAGELRRQPKDLALALASLVAVIGASILMEHAAVRLGSHYGVSDAVTGTVTLAAVTSLPNAVAAIYLARRGRGAAVLSEAMNSNALNVLVGLLLVGTLAGLGPGGGAGLEAAWWYGGLTLASLAAIYAAKGIGRLTGGAIIGTYLLFVVLLLR